MTTHIPTSPSPAGISRAGPALIALIVTTALALCVIAAVMITTGDGAAREAGGPQEAVVPLAPVTPATASPRVSVLLVGSLEEAVEARRAAALFSPEGLSPDVEFLTAGTSEEVRRAHETVLALRLQHGATSVSVTDLRGDGALPLYGVDPSCSAFVAQEPMIIAC
jgi:hypothetical protein